MKETWKYEILNFKKNKIRYWLEAGGPITTPPVHLPLDLFVHNVPMKMKVKVRSVLSDSLRPHGLYSPWKSPGQNTGVGSCSLLQGIFPTAGIKPRSPLFAQGGCPLVTGVRDPSGFLLFQKGKGLYCPLKCCSPGFTSSFNQPWGPSIWAVLFLPTTFSVGHMGRPARLFCVPAEGVRGPLPGLYPGLLRPGRSLHLTLPELRCVLSVPTAWSTFLLLLADPCFSFRPSLRATWSRRPPLSAPSPVSQWGEFPECPWSTLALSSQPWPRWVPLLCSLVSHTRRQRLDLPSRDPRMDPVSLTGACWKWD